MAHVRGARAPRTLPGPASVSTLQLMRAETHEETQHLWLRSHVHACTTPSSIVFLDVRRDAYLSLPLNHLPLIASFIRGWPLSAQQMKVESPSRDKAGELADRLLKQQLVTPSEAEGRLATAARIAPLVQPTCLRHQLPGVRMTTGDALRFLYACSRARKVLTEGLEGAVSRIAVRNAANTCPASIEDLKKAQEVTASFRRMRIWYFKADGRCLFHSLALAEFLFLYRLYPQLVLGVRTDRWAAHGWVQLGDCVLDSSPEKARFYTPIFVA